MAQKVSKRPKMAKNQDLGGILGELGGKTQFFIFKNQKIEIFGKFGIFSLFFFEFWSKKKLFWTEKGPILVQKTGVQNFFSRPIWGAKTFPHL